MGLPKNKILLRPDTEVLIGDWIAEVNRFTGQYTIYQIEEIVNEKSYFYGAIVETNDRIANYNPRATIGIDKGAHSYHKNCTWITYLLPSARVLYGK